MNISSNVAAATHLIKRCDNCGRFPEVRITHTTCDNIGVGSDDTVQFLKTSTKWNIDIRCKNCKTVPIAFETCSCEDVDNLLKSASEGWNHTYGISGAGLYQTTTLIGRIRELRAKSSECQVAIMDYMQNEPRLLLSGVVDVIDTILSNLPEMERISGTHRYSYEEAGLGTVQGVPNDCHKFYVFEPLLPFQVPYGDWGVPTDGELEEDE